MRTCSRLKLPYIRHIDDTIYPQDTNTIRKRICHANDPAILKPPAFFWTLIALGRLQSQPLIADPRALIFRPSLALWLTEMKIVGSPMTLDRFLRPLSTVLAQYLDAVALESHLRAWFTYNLD